MARPGRQHPLHPGHTKPPAPPPSRLLLPKFLAAKHPLLLCLGGPFPRSGEGAEPWVPPPGLRMGEGKSGPQLSPKANSYCPSCFSIYVTPVLYRNVAPLLVGAASRNLEKICPLDVPKDRHHSHQLAGSKGPNGNFINWEDNPVIQYYATGRCSAEHWIGSQGLEASPRSTRIP